MKSTLILALIMLILNETTSAINFQQKQGPLTECDFGRYKPVRISKKIPVIKQITPRYPPLAQKARVKGNVQVKVLIDGKGNVVQACAISGHPLLKGAATTAALQWKFEPHFGFSRSTKIRYVQDVIGFNFGLDE